MEVEYFGHSCFSFLSSKNIKIVIDPYDNRINKELPDDLKADIVLLTHEHFDHSAYRGIKGDPRILKRTGDFHVKHEIPFLHRNEYLIFDGIPSFHDKEKGKLKGPNTIFYWLMDGLFICHLGDLGHLLTNDQLKLLPIVDVLCIPVGGGITINSAEATLVIDQLKPKYVFPMHYKIPEIESKNLATDILDDFLIKMVDIETVEGNKINISKDDLPKAPRVIVFKNEQTN